MSDKLGVMLAEGDRLTPAFFRLAASLLLMIAGCLAMAFSKSIGLVVFYAAAPFATVFGVLFAVQAVRCNRAINALNRETEEKLAALRRED